MSSSSSPCAACKIMRRRCTEGCVFAPHFPADNIARFLNVQKVFGASNVSKLLNDLPPSERGLAVHTLVYEAEARLRDPVYGCVGYISILQYNIKKLSEEIKNAQNELAAYIRPDALLGDVPTPYAATGVGMMQQQQQHPYHQQQMHMPATVEEIKNTQNELAAYIGPDALLGDVPTPYAATGVGMMQPQQQHPYHQQQMHMHMPLPAIVEEMSREEKDIMMIRQAYAEREAADAPTAGAVPVESAKSATYDHEGASYLIQQQQQQQPPPSAPQHRLEPSPPPQSSWTHLGMPPHKQQQGPYHMDGSDDR